MSFDMWKKKENETKSDWVTRNLDILPACWDDGIVNEVCKQCHFEHCDNYKQVKRDIELRKKGIKR